MVAMIIIIEMNKHLHWMKFPPTLYWCPELCGPQPSDLPRAGWLRMDLDPERLLQHKGGPS